MDMLTEFFRGDYMPHGHCYLWRPSILWVNVISDILIALAYFSIPFVLVYFIRKRSDIKFRGVYVLFSAFILLCGVTHLFAIYTIWHGTYGLHGLSKALTAIVSITTACALVYLRKQILSIPSTHELTSALTLANDASRAKSQFLACMSHEIRTPINGVLGMLNLALKSEAEPAQRQRLVTAEESAKTLLRVINDILDVSKIEAGRLDIETVAFNVHELARDLVRGFAIDIREKPIELILDLSEVSAPMLTGDPVRIRQILNNLISNAIKFTAKGKVSIKGTLQLLKDNQYQLIFSVQDSGIGIPEDRLENIFEPFTQADTSTTRQFGGTGLGLTICKQLAQLMRGDISVTSTPNQGSEFTFHVMVSLVTNAPENREMLSALEDGSDAEKRESKTLAIIIDPFDDSRHVLEKQLRQFGVGVSSFQQPYEALLALKECPSVYKYIFIDVCVLDTEITSNFKQYMHEHGRLIVVHYPDELDGTNLQVESLERLAKPLSPSELLRCLNYTKPESHQVVSNDKKMAGRFLNDMRILVVEDNLINQQVVEGILEDLAINFSFANNGKEAISKLSSSSSNNPFHIILMDCQMPEMDGYTATRKIREGSAGNYYKNIIIIAMTANALKGDRERCLASGMDDYISKPIDPDHLESVLTSYVDQAMKDMQELARAQTMHDSEEVLFPQKMEFIDREKIPKSLTRRPERLISLFSSFIDNNTGFNQQVLDCIEAKRYNELGEIIHAMKGVSGNIGMNKLFDVSCELDLRLKNGEELETLDVGRLMGAYNNSVREIQLVIRLNIQSGDED